MYVRNMGRSIHGQRAQDVEYMVHTGFLKHSLMWNQSEIDYDLWLLLCELCLLSLLIANLIDLASLKHPKPTDNVNRSEWTTIRVNHHHSQSVFELRANKSFWYSMLSTSPRVSEWMTFLICIWTWRHHHLRIRYSKHFNSHESMAFGSRCEISARFSKRKYKLETVLTRNAR